MSIDNREKFPASALLIILAVLIIAVPLLILPKAEFGGSDGQGQAAITDINPSYKPWIDNIWTPPSKEIETLLFCLQAALGGGVLGYGIGYLRGKKSSGR